MTTGILEVRGLCSGYGPVKVLQDVDISVPQGTITAVLGANGAGKTTLLRVLAGVREPDGGRLLRGSTVRAAFLSQELKELPAGSFYTEPANVPHFVQTRGAVVIQVSGTGPSARRIKNQPPTSAMTIEGRPP